jgi:nitrous oxidase accessory protein NosD
MKNKMLALTVVITLLTSMFLIAIPIIPISASPAEIHVPADYSTIQYAVGNASSGDTIIVAAGTYAGAIVDKNVTISGASGGASIITSGVPYKTGSSLYTAFRLDATADGAEIRNFTINCNSSESFYFAIFSRTVDNAIVDSLTVNDAVQGISNWGGSNWEITNNVMNDTEAAGGGGIAIFLGAYPPSYPVCSGNLVQGNTITATATAPDYTCPGVSLSLDLRYGAYDDLTGSEDVSDNQILDNNITAPGSLNGVGIETGVIGLEGNATKIAATLGIVHDNDVQGNVIDGADMGIYFYTVTNLTIRQNEISNCNEGIHNKDGSDGNTINYNNIVDNTIGLNMSARAQVCNNTIEGGRAGIWLRSGPYSISTTIKGNTITDFVKAGIVTRGTKDIFIEGNTISTTIHDEAPNGIDIGTYSGTNGTIKENEISGCSWKDFTGDYESSWSGSGILVIESGDSFEITRNIVHDCDVGMDIESDSMNITRNEVYSNIYGFVFWNGKPKVNYNNIYNNTQYGVCRTYDLTGVLNAECNWWGDSSGPSGVGPGTGDAVSDSVLFDPWLSCYQPQIETQIYINPPLVEKYAFAGVECIEFAVDVRISSVTDLWGFDFELTWNSTLLNLTKIEYESQLNTLWGEDLWSVVKSNVSTGWYKFAALALNPATGFSGSAALVRLTFHIEYGPCYIEPNYQLQTRLHFALVKLSDSKADPICTKVQDGTYIIYAVKPWLKMYYTRTNLDTITCRKLSETFTLRIKLVDAFKVSDFEIEIRYNATLMNPVIINWGNLTGFLPGPYIIKEYTVDYVTGSIRFHLSENVTAGAPLAYGDGVLVEITFNVTKTKMWKKIDDCPVWENYFHDLIEFTYWNISVRCPSAHFLTGDLVKITNAEYWYTAIQGDINSDGDVGVLDLRTVSYYYEVKQGDPDWAVASKYDLNCDGIIDIYDLTLITTNFGYEYGY